MTEWENCPRCESNRVKIVSRSTTAMKWWLAAVVFTLVGLIFWPLLIVAALCFLVSPLPLILPRQRKCKDCENVW